ncbi:MAG TPA: hypothetical protein VJ878_02530 [Candidatus Izemoplasmatales bacterium]|nr:hypothetical protein [Candidatus Izemoplasmatales bacterium]
MSTYFDIQTKFILAKYNFLLENVCPMKRISLIESVIIDNAYLSAIGLLGSSKRESDIVVF